MEVHKGCSSGASAGPLVGCPFTLQQQEMGLTSSQLYLKRMPDVAHDAGDCDRAEACICCCNEMVESLVESLLILMAKE